MWGWTPVASGTQCASYLIPIKSNFCSIWLKSEFSILSKGCGSQRSLRTKTNYCLWVRNEWRDNNIVIKSASTFSYFLKSCQHRQDSEFSSQRGKSEEEKAGLLLLIPTASFQPDSPPPPPCCAPLVVPTYHTRRRPHWAVQVWINTSPSEASVFVEGWSEATCREAPLLSHCSAALSERSGVPPSMLDWA